MMKKILLSSRRAGLFRMAIASFVVLGFAAVNSQAAVIALWKFDQGAGFLTDSSGNGNTLQDSFGSATSVADDFDGAGGASTGSALFDGDDILGTINALDLSGSSRIRVSWWARVDATSIGVAFEHSINNNANAGGFISTVNEDAAGEGRVGIRGNAGVANFDSILHSTDGTTWQQFAVEFDIVDSILAGDVTQVVTGGTGGNVGGQATDIGPFRNDNFFIGGRADGGLFGFNGGIDELQIESLVTIPEPNSLLLGLLGAVGVRCSARKRRSS